MTSAMDTTGVILAIDLGKFHSQELGLLNGLFGSDLLISQFESARQLVSQGGEFYRCGIHIVQNRRVSCAKQTAKGGTRILCGLKLKP